LQATSRALAKAHDLFDDAKDRLDAALAFAVVRTTLFGFQGVGHFHHGTVRLGCGRIGREPFPQRQMMCFMAWAMASTWTNRSSSFHQESFAKGYFYKFVIPT